MNKRIEPELPSITPDLDQVEDFKQSQSTLKNKPSFTPEPATPNAPVKSNGFVTWLGVISILALSAGGYGLYQQNQATLKQLKASELRISELERALSATGEEMGESAGAIRAKLTDVSERTDELWKQMDKLWASAWRRNQSEIKKLQTQTTALTSAQAKQGQSHSNVATKLNTLSEAHTEVTLKLSLLQEQIQAAETLKGQLASLNTDLDKLKSQSQGRDAKQIEIGSSIAQLEITQNALAEQLEKLESQLAPVASTTQSSNASN